MLKKLILSAAVLFAVLSINAQQSFNTGDKALNAGIGLGWGYGSGYIGINTLAPIPSFNASFEVGIFEIENAGVISLGGFASFRRTWDDGSIAGYHYRYEYNNAVLAARGVFHLNFLNTDVFDVYGGIHSGLRFSGYTYEYDYENFTESDNDIHFIHDLFVGARYMMSQKFGFFAEAGYGISYLKGGITLKF